MLLIVSKAQATDSIYVVIDEMKAFLSSMQDQKKKVRLYVDIGEKYEDEGEIDSAKVYYLKGRDLSWDINDKEGLYDASSSYIATLNHAGMFDSALVVSMELLSLMQKDGDQMRIAHTQYMIASTYAQKEFYETALSHFREALAYYESEGNARRMGMVYNVMQVIYLEMDATDKAIEFGERALSATKGTPSYPYSLLNTANSYANTFPRQYGKAEQCLEELLTILEKDSNSYLEGLAYNNLADIYIKTFKWKEAEVYFRKALEVFTQLGYEINIYTARLGLAYLEAYKGNTESAQKMALEILEYTTKQELQTDMRRSLELLANLASVQKDFRGMRMWNEAADSIEQVIVNRKLLHATEELLTKYETEKKELRITVLEEEKNLIIWLGATGITVLVLMIALFFFLWRWTVQKKCIVEQQHQLAEQQVKQLEQEKQLVATQSILDGETAERTRLSRDLHDGLGSILTGVKLNLEDLKGHVILPQSSLECFNKAFGMLNESMVELRRVAHHLMPDSLSRYGLKVALTDFCNSFSNITFGYFGDESRLDPKLEVMIYRIIHELVNNVLKHAEAKQITVQVMCETEYIAFIVLDDGKGFNSSIQPQGMGLENIRNRVASFNGRMDIMSKEGKGTEVNVEFILKSN